MRKWNEVLEPDIQFNVILTLDGFLIQMVMAVFSYIYYQSFISPHHYSIESFLDQILVNLSLEEQMGLYKQLGEALTRIQR